MMDRRTIVWTVLVIFLGLEGASAPAHAGESPLWVWLGNHTKDNQELIFRKSFGVQGKISKAILYGTCDNHMEVRINGRKVLASSEWSRPVQQDVTEQVHGGGNLLAVWARNDSGPAGLLLKLVIHTDKGEQVIVTDSTWRVTDKSIDNWTSPYTSDADWPHATAIHPLGAPGTWDSITAETLANAANGARVLPGAIPAEEIKTLPGFKAERLYSVPRWQGSWVSMTIDPKGRLITSDQYGALYRITPPAIGDDPESGHVEKLDVKLGFAHGLLYAFDSLYVMKNEGGAGLYRLRDTNGDDQFDDVQLLKPIQGGGEHGPHGIVLGPDGRSIYLVSGNHTKLPEGITSSRVPQVWDEDFLLPRHWDANGHARGVLAPGGWICRTDPQGKTWELFSIGMRNTYDIAFNRNGELFGYDSDMEWDWGLPWYRPTRIDFHASGSDFGWRSGTSKWPEYFPDGYPPVVNIGMGSPTGVTFGTGARFPAKYQRAFFALDWTYGRLYAVHIKPDGAGYTGTFEPFATGKPLPLTDVVIGHDGAMYFTIGGRRIQSGLYRIRYVGSESTAPAPPVLYDKDTLAAQALRKQLEFFHGKQHPDAVKTAWPHLGSPDRFIRYAARVAIEHQPVTEWRSLALAETRPHAIIEAMIALARHGEPSVQPLIFERLDTLPLSKLPESQLLAALRAYSLAMIRLGRPDNAIVNRLGKKFDAMYPAASVLVNRELCRLVIYLGAPHAVTDSLKLLLESPTQEDQVYYAYQLRNAKTGWTMSQRKLYFQWMHHAITRYSGGNSFTKYLRMFQDDAIHNLTEAQLAQLDPIINAPVERDQPVAAKPRRYVFNWQMDDLVPLLDKLKSGRSFKNGRDAFAATRCLECHRFAGEGGSTGPDLTGAGNRFSAQDILEQILYPSRVISDQYADTDFVLVDGQVISGRIESETNDAYMVRTDPLALEPIEVFKEDIKEQELSKISKMPEGLLSVLEKRDILDLIAYLRSGGNPNDPAFSK